MQMEYLPIVIIFMLLAAVFCLLAKLFFLSKDLEVLVKDVGSTNGTYLNEHKLKKEKSEKLNPGDVISMAGFMYECR